MEAIKKQASKLREQVARQQQAVMKQFSGRFAFDGNLLEEVDARCHQQLQMLCSSTKEAKRFQRNIVKMVEALISVSSKQMEIVSKLSDDCHKYGENQIPGTALARASIHFGNSHSLMEKEREVLLRVLADKVYEPLRAMIMSAPLEDARHLSYRYEKIRQDVEAQSIDVAKRQMKSKEPGVTHDGMKLKQAEERLSDLSCTLSALGQAATAAMKSVEVQQQQLTFQQLLAMVDAERTYHQKVASILDELHNMMIMEKKQSDSERQSTPILSNADSLTVDDETKSRQATTLQAASSDDVQAQENREDAGVLQSGDIQEAYMNGAHSQPAKEENIEQRCSDPPEVGLKQEYFIAEVIHQFDAQADVELSLSVGDYVVVRQVAQGGWSEGECKGKAGWFPSAYTEVRDKAPANKLIEAGKPS